jgi:hypothetical protein
MIPIFIPSNSGPMSNDDIKVIMGIWIIINILWIITWIITGVRYLLSKLIKNWYFDGRFELAIILDVVVLIVWSVFGLVKAGIIISKYL